MKIIKTYTKISKIELIVTRVFIAILLVLSLTISMLSYKLQIEATAIEKENEQLREIIEINKEEK